MDSLSPKCLGLAVEAHEFVEAAEVKAFSVFARQLFGKLPHDFLPIAGAPCAAQFLLGYAPPKQPVARNEVDVDALLRSVAGGVNDGACVGEQFATVRELQPAILDVLWHGIYCIPIAIKFHRRLLAPASI